jgi:hypothetical protein
VSEHNVELHRGVAAAFTARDVEAFIAYFDPRVEFCSEFAPLGGLYHGHVGMRRLLEDFEDAWGDEMHIHPRTYFDLGERTLLFLDVRARGNRSGVEVTLLSAHLITWRNGLVIRFRGYTERSEALSDLGVSEDALDPIEA